MCAVCVCVGGEDVCVCVSVWCVCERGGGICGYGCEVMLGVGVWGVVVH